MHQSFNRFPRICTKTRGKNIIFYFILMAKQNKTSVIPDKLSNAALALSLKYCQHPSTWSVIFFPCPVLWTNQPRCRVRLYRHSAWLLVYVSSWCGDAITDGTTIAFPYINVGLGWSAQTPTGRDWEMPSLCGITKRDTGEARLFFKSEFVTRIPDSVYIALSRIWLWNVNLMF